jgi:hypothetical protein
VFSQNLPHRQGRLDICPVCHLPDSHFCGSLRLTTLRYLSELVNRNVYLFDSVEHMHNSLVVEEMYQLLYSCFAAQFAPYLGGRCKNRDFQCSDYCLVVVHNHGPICHGISKKFPQVSEFSKDSESADCLFSFSSCGSNRVERTCPRYASPQSVG